MCGGIHGACVHAYNMHTGTPIFFSRLRRVAHTEEGSLPIVHYRRTRPAGGTASPTPHHLDPRVVALREAPAACFDAQLDVANARPARFRRRQIRAHGGGVGWPGTSTRARDPPVQCSPLAPPRECDRTRGRRRSLSSHARWRCCSATVCVCVCARGYSSCCETARTSCAGATWGRPTVRANLLNTEKCGLSAPWAARSSS